MKSSTLSTRIDEPTKTAFSQVCEDVGLSTSQAIQLFAKAVVNYGGIPFEIKTPKPNVTTLKAMQAFDNDNNAQSSLETASDFAHLMSQFEIENQNKADLINNDAKSDD